MGAALPGLDSFVATAPAREVPVPRGDRRAAPRTRVTWRVQLTCGAEEQVSHSTDASLCGMFLETRQPIAPGETVHLSFTVLQGGRRETVEVSGEVARAVTVEEARRSGTLPGNGVRFVRFVWGAQAFAETLEELLSLPPAETRRRSAPRLPVGLPLYWGHEPSQRRFAGLLSNLSTGGAFLVESSELATQGSRLHLWFEVPCAGRLRPVRAVARVVRVVAPEAAGGGQVRGMGIALATSDVDLRALASFLDGRLASVAPAESAERTHPTRIDDLFLAAVNEWETHGLAAVGAVGADVGRARPFRIVAAPAAPHPSRVAVNWGRVGAAAIKVGGVLAVALLGLFVGLILQVL
jgi:hypothetical protein